MKTYEQRITELESEGLTTSDAQAVIDAEDMKRRKHTPAPWTISTGDIIAITTDDYLIANVEKEGDNDMPRMMQEANARLIAAAPELLEALEAIVKDWQNNIEYCERVSLFDYLLDDARAAIAKARGKQ